MWLALRPAWGIILLNGQMGLVLRPAWDTSLLNGEMWLALQPVKVPIFRMVRWG